MCVRVCACVCACVGTCMVFIIFMCTYLRIEFGMITMGIKI